MYKGVPCMHRAFRVQNRALDPLGLDLQTVVSHHLGAGNQT